MREEDLEVALKVVIVGDGGVGKSSMIQRYCRGTFTRDYKKTIGVDFLERQIEIDGEEVRLMLWDTAGQEEFDAITKAYYRGAHACVLAFSTTDRDSFLSLHSWKLKRRSGAGGAGAGLPTDAGVSQGGCERGGCVQGVSGALSVRYEEGRRRRNAAVSSTRYRNIYKSQQQWHDPAAADEAPTGRQEEERAKKRLQTTVMSTLPTL